MKGVYASSFSLLAYLSDYKYRGLTFYCTESGYLKKNDTINYNLELYSVNSTNITISLDELYGETQLYLKKCNNSKYGVNCSVTAKEIYDINYFDGEDGERKENKVE